MRAAPASSRRERGTVRLVGRVTGRLLRLASSKGIALRFSPVVLVLVASSAGMVIGLALGDGPGAVIGAVCGAFTPWLALRMAPDRRDARLGTQVPEFIDAVARSLRSGRSLVGAVSGAVCETREPLAGELRPMLLRIEAGIGLRDSLAATRTATANRPLHTALSALSIANEAGGAQAMVLDALAASLRSRVVAGRELRALATPVRVSATLIGLAPPAVMGAVVAIDPNTASHAYAQPAGRAAVVVGVALDLVGLWWIRRLTRFAP